MARLWEYDEHGEPWLENMPLLIINRKRKKGTKKKGRKAMARRRRRVSRRRVRRHRVAAPRRVHRRRRRSYRRRRNPWPMAGTVASINPRRRRRRGRRASPRRHRRGKRNPRILGLTFPPVEAVAFGALGYLATPMVEGFINGVLPVSITTTTIGKYATRIASVLGLTWLAKMAGLRGRAAMIGIGGGMYVATSALKEFASGMIPLSAAAALPQVSAYALPTLGRMGSYSAPTEATYHGGFQQLGAPNFGAQNTVRSAPFGGARLVAQRFRRFN